jgi:hypothetical protein
MKYGSEGYDIIAAGQRLPAYAKVNYISGAERVWVPMTQDVQALEKPAGEGRIAAGRSAGLHEIIDVAMTDGSSHDVSLYLVDWDRTGRWTAVDTIDALSRKRLDTQNVINFGSGLYLRYRVSGRVQFRITNVWTKRYTISPDAGFSALFFDPSR